MKPGSIIELQGAAGEHGMLNGQKCPGRRFVVLESGVGGIYEDRVECKTCDLQLFVYGNHVLDPMAEALLESADLEAGLFAIRTTYRFRHGNANGVESNPDLWFHSEAKARDAFSRITPQAAIKAWPARHHMDVLESVTVSLHERDEHEWHEIEKWEFKTENKR